MKWLSIATQNKRGESKSNKREGMKKGGVVERGGAVRREKRKRKSMYFTVQTPVSGGYAGAAFVY